MIWYGKSQNQSVQNETNHRYMIVNNIIMCNWMLMFSANEQKLVSHSFFTLLKNNTVFEKLSFVYLNWQSIATILVGFGRFKRTI